MLTKVNSTLKFKPKFYLLRKSRIYFKWNCIRIILYCIFWVEKKWF